MKRVRVGVRREPVSVQAGQRRGEAGGGTPEGAPRAAGAAAPGAAGRTPRAGTPSGWADRTGQPGTDNGPTEEPPPLLTCARGRSSRRACREHGGHAERREPAQKTEKKKTPGPKEPGRSLPLGREGS